jgi:lincosamide nucleotidyltransferase A/C/D/E
VVISLDSAVGALAALAVVGFELQVDQRPTRMVVSDSRDRRIDFHTVTFGENGDGVQVLHDGTPWAYPAEGFTGRGTIGGRAVNCLSVVVQALCHLDYEPDDDDRRDMDLLCREFGLDLPPRYGP